jgi:hypothetical protein
MVQFPVIIVIPKATVYQLVMAAEVHIRHGVELSKKKCKMEEMASLSSNGKTFIERRKIRRNPNV